MDYEPKEREIGMVFETNESYLFGQRLLKILPDLATGVVGAEFRLDTLFSSRVLRGAVVVVVVGRSFLGGTASVYWIRISRTPDVPGWCRRVRRRMWRVVIPVVGRMEKGRRGRGEAVRRYTA